MDITTKRKNNTYSYINMGNSYLDINEFHFGNESAKFCKKIILIGTTLIIGYNFVNYFIWHIM
jgi:hypothetical protein